MKNKGLVFGLIIVFLAVAKALAFNQTVFTGKAVSTSGSRVTITAGSFKCVDSDAGLEESNQIKTQGSAVRYRLVSGKWRQTDSKNDKCVGGKIQEATCTERAAIRVESKSCPSNTECKDGNGKCIPLAVCGNGKKEGSEQCDKNSLGGKTCSSYMPTISGTKGVRYKGTLKCNSNCKFDTSRCRAI